MTDKNPSRRDFVETAAKSALAAAFVPNGFPMIVPRHVLGGPGYQAPSDTLNFAVVGFGGMGSGNANVLAQAENLVAVCDVDLAFADRNVSDHEKERAKDGTLRPEGAVLRAKFDKARPTHPRGHPDGEPGPLGRRHAEHRRVDPRRHHRPRA